MQTNVLVPAGIAGEIATGTNPTGVYRASYEKARNKKVHRVVVTF